MDDLTKSPEIPLGLSMALASNPYAMSNFSQMTSAQKRDIIERTNSIGSKKDMERFVETLEH